MILKDLQRKANSPDEPGGWLFSYNSSKIFSIEGKNMKNLFAMVLIVLVVVMGSGCGLKVNKVVIKTDNIEVVKDANSLTISDGDNEMIFAGGVMETTIPAHTFTIYTGPDESYSENVYIVIWREDSDGDLVNGSTGASSSSVTWAQAVIAGTEHAENGHAYNFPAPDLVWGPFIKYGVGVFDNATPAKTNAMEGGPYRWNPSTNETFGDGSPLIHNTVQTSRTP